MAKRTLAAFAIAPLAVPLVIIVSLWTTGQPLIGRDLVGLVPWILMVSSYSLLIGYSCELVLGLPAWLVFRHYNIRSMGMFAACGVLIGLLADLGVSIWSGMIVFLLNALSQRRFGFDLTLLAPSTASAVLFRAIVFSGGSTANRGATARSRAQD